VETLIKDGKISHAFIGIGVNDVTPANAKFFHRDEASGAVVTDVQPDAPGAKAGLKAGDVITAVDGHKVDDGGQLQVLVGQKRPGTKVNLQLFRDGKTMNVPVTLEEMGSRDEERASSGREQGKGRWGIGLSDLTPDARQQLQLPRDVRGALVARVQPGSPADNAGISQGDIVLEVNRQQTGSAADAKQALGKIPNGEDALLLVRSNGGNSFRVLHSAETSGE
jgi:serine protease Do